MGSHLPQPPQPDRRSLTSHHPKMIFIPYITDVHPWTTPSPGALGYCRMANEPMAAAACAPLSNGRTWTVTVPGFVR